MEWRKNEFNEFIGSVPVHTQLGDGVYHIYIQPRPIYCDRGDWIIHIDSEGASDLDWADGFPRYFFGTTEEVQKQMETWIAKRKECQHD